MRIVLLVLVAANVLFFGYTRGVFDGILGLNSQGEREPGRLARQVRPETIRVLGPQAASVAATTSCYEAGPISAADAAGAEAVLRAALPAGSWSDVRGDSVGAAGPAASHTYRVVNADAGLVTRLTGLRLDAGGRAFSACGRPDRPR